MKGKRFLSITVAAACLLMNVPASAFAAGTAEAARTNETAVSQAVSASAVKTAQVKVTASEPYTLTIDDVKVYQCREDDNNSDSPLIEALWIFGLKDDVDFSDAKYKNIVIPETLPYEVPDLDEEGKEQKDEEGNVIKKTVVMPVIKFGLGSVAPKNNLEKLTFSKNLRVFTDNLADYKNLSEIVIPEDSSLESFASGAFQGTSIKSIYIPASVTSLADNMFFNCTSLTSVTFAPDSKLQKIGAYAFSGTSLESIDIPATVTEIGESAFGINYAPNFVSTCQFEKIVLPDGLETIPNTCFLGCKKLREVTFGSGLKTIGNNAFQNTALVDLVVPDTVTTIGPNAFSECHALRSVKIGSGVKELGGCSWLEDQDVLSRFAQDENIEKVEFSEGLEKIGDNAFSGSRKIKSLTIPSTVKNIGNYAFGGTDASLGMTALSKLTFAENSQLENIFENAFKYASIKHLVLPVAPEPFKIWDSAFEGCGELVDVDLGNCKQIGSATFYSSEQVYLENGTGGGAFQGCRNLKTVNFEEDTALEIINHGSFIQCDELMGPVVFPASLKKIGHSAFKDCAVLDEVTFNEGLETIGNMGFLGCNLSEIILPDTVKSVGTRSFEACYAVEKVKLSAGMTVVPYRFLDCHSDYAPAGAHSLLKELVIPDNIKEIQEQAFQGCLKLETIDLGQVEIIRKGAFCLPEHNNGSLKSIKMSPCLKEIGTVVNASEYEVGSVFEGHSYFDGLELPPTVEIIYDNAFLNCPSVKEFTMTENLKFVGSHAFDGCVNLTKVDFLEPENTDPDDNDGGIKTEFEDCIFLNCTGLKSVSLPGGLGTIPDRLFSGCYNLTDVTFGEGIETIGSGAFADTGLTSLELPESCIYIDEAAFQNVPITSLKLSSKTQIIGENAFVRDTHNDLLKSVYIPESVKSIGTRAFGWYKDGDKGYAQLEREGVVNPGKVLGPTIADKEFTLYGGKAAEKYAEMNDMIYGGKEQPDKPSLPVTLRGDVDVSGEVDVSDAVTLARFLTGDKINVTDQGLANADANASGKTDTEDVIYIVKIVAGTV